MFGRRTILAALISVLAAVALGVSAFLTWETWDSGSVAGCTGESAFECDEVLSSRWSKWVGLPVSLLGSLTYAAILALVWPAASRARGTAVTCLFGISLLAVGAAVWFVGLQAIQVESFCSYCLAVHSCGLVISILSFLLFLDGSGAGHVEQARNLLGVVDASDDVAPIDEPAEPISLASLGTSLAISAVGLVVLMGGQLLVEPPETMAMEELNFDAIEQPAEEISDEPTVEPTDEVIADSPPAPPTDESEITANEPTEAATADEDWLDSEAESMQAELLDEPATIDSIFGSGASLSPGKIAFRALSEPIDPKKMPVLGNPNAPYVMVELMDYTCHHCRKLHPRLEAALERYGDQLCIVIFNVPLSKKCNARVAKDYPGKRYACDYAQLSIGMWKLAPEEYAEFHHWLLDGEKPPSIVKAKQRARKLAGTAILIDKEMKADTSRRLAKQSEDWKRLNAGLPIMLVPDGGLRGVPETPEKLFEFLETKLGIQPKS